MDHGAVARAAIVRAIELELLGAIGKRWRTLTRISESGKDQAINALWLLHGVSARAEGAR